MKYYKVIAKRGHCGAKKHSDFLLGIAAENAVDAAFRAMKFPSLKHSSIPQVVEISHDEYLEIRKVNAYSRYKQGNRR